MGERRGRRNRKSVWLPKAYLLKLSKKFRQWAGSGFVLFYGPEAWALCSDDSFGGGAVGSVVAGCSMEVCMQGREVLGPPRLGPA